MGIRSLLVVLFLALSVTCFGCRSSRRRPPPRHCDACGEVIQSPNVQVCPACDNLLDGSAPVATEGQCPACGEIITSGARECPACQARLDGGYDDPPPPPPPANESRRCPGCGDEILDPNLRQCPNCESRVQREEPQRKCGVCGDPLAPSAASCAACEQKARMERESARQVAKKCPGCGGRIMADVDRCPSCEAAARRSNDEPAECPDCGYLVRPGEVCSRCNPEPTPPPSGPKVCPGCGERVLDADADSCLSCGSPLD